MAPSEPDDDRLVQPVRRAMQRLEQDTFDAGSETWIAREVARPEGQHVVVTLGSGDGGFHLKAYGPFAAQEAVAIGEKVGWPGDQVFGAALSTCTG